MRLTDFPLFYCVFAFAVLWLAARVGIYLRKRRAKQDPTERDDLSVIAAAAMTLLGLLIGFSFSMAINRYDQRKNYEEEEANAIGTEYLRAGLLPANPGANARKLLRSYLDQRILFYTTQNHQQLERIDEETARLQNELWSVVQAVSTAQPSPITALVAAGMNDVLNSQGYTQAAWWNRIPRAAWALLMVVGVFCNVLFGYNTNDPESRTRHVLLLPMIVAISFFLIADIDSPRHGVIRLPPQNLLSLSGSLPASQVEQQVTR